MKRLFLTIISFLVYSRSAQGLIIQADIYAKEDDQEMQYVYVFADYHTVADPEQGVSAELMRTSIEQKNELLSVINKVKRLKKQKEYAFIVEDPSASFNFHFSDTDDSFIQKQRSNPQLILNLIDRLKDSGFLAYNAEIRPLLAAPSATIKQAYTIFSRTLQALKKCHDNEILDAQYTAALVEFEGNRAVQHYKKHAPMLNADYMGRYPQFFDEYVMAQMPIVDAHLAHLFYTARDKKKIVVIVGVWHAQALRELLPQLDYHLLESSHGGVESDTAFLNPVDTHFFKEILK